MHFSTFAACGLAAISSLSSTVLAASLTRVTDFGTNPGNAQMYIYVPDKLPANPAIIVSMHYCGGTATTYFNMNKLPALADTHGYIMIVPSATHDNNCWDAATNATLTHNGGSDSLSIVNMVKYTISKYNADPTRVFATGSSSGAIMTNVLCGAYPDVFAAGSGFSGMAYGCLAGSPGSSPQSADPACANGQHIYTPEKWASMVRAGYPGYNGTYPRMQLWHGTADNIIKYQSLIEQVKEWSAVLGVEFTKNVTNTPKPGYTRMIFGDGSKMEAYSAQGVGHFVPTDEPSVLSWFGITS
ncbi:Feruloyl esterase B [Venustampulla echinocandica]|uniref:Carboxylic ester hydrolase n=1 Tax=Venustampulla echinocandica TaxID=2656787 RepID=A0A370TPK3_9HELO|nr:Feruloyl esterase B [Venustampulla echinocandica]RDL37453.1 Feruloyl esterase B [Venustampulla echinocandica]